MTNARPRPLVSGPGLGLVLVVLALCSCERASGKQPASAHATLAPSPPASPTSRPPALPAPDDYPIAIEGPRDDIDSIRSVLLRRDQITGEQVRFVEEPELATRLATRVCEWDRIVLVSGADQQPMISVEMRVEEMSRPPSERPTRRISSFSLSTDGAGVLVPPSSFADLRPPRFCNSGFAKAWALQSHDREYLYIYLLGGDGATAYGAKWVFSRSGFVTRILLRGDFVDYLPAI